MKINVSQDFRILLNLINVRGRHSLLEILSLCGVKSTRKEHYRLMKELIDLKILKVDGIKYTKFGKVNLYRVDEEELAKLMENHEEIRWFFKQSDEIRSVLY